MEPNRKMPLWFVFMWSACVASTLAGASVLITGFAKHICKTVDDGYLTIVLVCFVSQLVLASLFVFQCYLFRLKSNVDLVTRTGVSLQAYSFAILYGLAGMDLVLRGLRNLLRETTVADRVEIVFGVLSLFLWATILTFQRFRRKPRPTD